MILFIIIDNRYLYFLYYIYKKVIKCKIYYTEYTKILTIYLNDICNIYNNNIYYFIMKITTL